MLIETVKDGFRYRLSNGNIQVGDTVWPIGRGRHVEEGVWLIHELEWSNFDLRTPHIVEHIWGSTIDTLRGYGYIGVYFKLAKVEKHVKLQSLFSKFVEWEWLELTASEILALLGQGAPVKELKWKADWLHDPERTKLVHPGKTPLTEEEKL